MTSRQNHQPALYKIVTSSLRSIISLLRAVPEDVGPSVTLRKQPLRTPKANFTIEQFTEQNLRNFGPRPIHYPTNPCNNPQTPGSYPTILPSYPHPSALPPLRSGRSSRIPPPARKGFTYSTTGPKGPISPKVPSQPASRSATRNVHFP